MALPQHHKSLSIDLLLPISRGGDGDQGSSSSAMLSQRETSSSSLSRTRPQPRRKGGYSSPDPLDAIERQERQQQLVVDGKPAHVALTAAGIEWWAPGGAAQGSAAVESVPFSEMLSAQCREAGSLGMLPCLRVRMHRLEVFTFRRARQRPCEWSPRRLVLEAADEEIVQDWAAAISRGIEAAAAAGRPRNLLVVLNPNSGHRQGRRVWRCLAAPVFAAAGIKATVRETRRQGHASEIVAGLGLEQLGGIDGVVCVGGDGVFHEALNGLIQARAAAAEGGHAELAAALSALRLAHIPAGSTDAVACTLHGTRGAFTAAMHVALGDSTPLDVLRVDTAQGTKFASCIAAYGFLADVTAEAERYRWLGPARYDLVGAAKLAVSRAYPARIRYLEGEVGRALSKHSRSVCGTECTVCRAASFMHARRMSQHQLAVSASGPSGGGNDGGSSSRGGSQQASPSARRVRPGSSNSLGSNGAGGGSGRGGGDGEPGSPGSLQQPAAAAAAASGTEAELGSGSPRASPFLQPAAGAADRHTGEEWQELEGEFCSIMLIVMPCRSDKTRQGMARFGHLADGRIKLVLVRKCSPLQYLRFLHGMSRHGCAPGQLPYVQVLDAVAVEVLPGGNHSRHSSVSLGGMGSLGGSGGSGHQPSPCCSCWNLDGELVVGPNMRVSAEVHHGLLRVFSRGVEQ